MFSFFLLSLLGLISAQASVCNGPCAYYAKQCFCPSESSAPAPVAAPSLDGNYILDTKIGNQVFQDHLSLHGKAGVINLFALNTELSGTLTVTGAFSSPVTGNARCNPWTSTCEIDFSILATENGSSYTVNYSLALSYPDAMNLLGGKEYQLTGNAYLSNQQLLGSVIGKRVMP